MDGGRGSTLRLSRPAALAVAGLLASVFLSTDPVHAQVYTWSHFAGPTSGPSGSADGTGSAARFSHPAALAVDSGGNVFVADTSNHTIRKITPAKVVTTFAGLAGSPGSANGTGSAARFNLPNGVAVDSAGNVYVGDSSNHTIRKISSAGAVTTLAGLAGATGSVDGTGSAARFSFPTEVAVDSVGNVFVADTSNHTIRKISPAGAVTTFAGLAGSTGSADGTGSAARFNTPSGVAVDPAGNVYVGDKVNNTIRKITAARVVSTLAGLAGTWGSTDGTGQYARFNYPTGVAADSIGNVYVADTSMVEHFPTSNTIRKVSPAGAVTTIGGLAGSLGSADGPGATARFYYPNGIAVDAGGNPFVADTYNHTIRAGAVPLSITFFTASPSTITAGQSSTLSWASVGGSSAAIGLTPVPTSGSLQVSPTQTTSYVLTVIGPTGPIYASVTVTVLAGAPQITSFTANPPTIASGQSSTLSWASSGGTSASLSGGVGAVPTSGTRSVSPAVTTTYTLSVTGPGGTTTASVTVVVGTPPVIASFTANPPTIASGQSSTLSWASSGGTSASLSGVGSVSVSGSASVSPTVTTTYTLTVTGPGGTATASATVTVSASGPVITSFTASPATIAAGQSSLLSWTSTGGTSASLDLGIGAVSTSGSRSVSPAVSSAYTLTVIGPGGTTTATVTITVVAGSSLAVLSISPASGLPAGGAPVTITGSGFLSGATVTIGGLPATDVVFSGSATLAARTPAHCPGPAHVMVTNPGGESATLPDGYRYASTAPLAVQTISPASGSVSGGTAVTILGSGFDSSVAVTLGGVPVSSLAVFGSTMITAVTGPHPAGPVSVAVSLTSACGAGATLINGFTYISATSLAVQSIAPSSGTSAGGGTVTITGTGFVSGAAVTLGGASATNVVVSGPTSISARTSAQCPGPADVTVTNPGGESATLAGGYAYVSAVPLAVQSTNPVSGSTAGGTAVTITGTGFGAPATVIFGGVPATSVTVLASTTITAVTAPHGAGAVDVEVFDPCGQSGALGGGYSYVSATSPLTVQAASPNYGPTTGGTFVTITGTGFQSPASVAFGGSAYPGTQASVLGPTTISVRAPAHMSGLVGVTVSCNGSVGTLPDGFRYTDVPVHLDSLSPTTGRAGDTVTITGSGFGPGTAVTFNGVSATSVTSQMDGTVLKCVVPQSSGFAIPVVVSVPGGGTATGSFTYIGASSDGVSLTSVTPSAGQPGGGTAVTITGTGFQSGAIVNFDTSPATNVSVLSPTVITATVPSLPAARLALAVATGEAQPVSVFVRNPSSGAAGGPSAYTYTPPGGGCVTAGLTQCLGGNRFSLQVTWKNPYDGGTVGVGKPIRLTSDTGTFWFFSSQNIELMVKVLDGRATNGYFWVFYGALSDVEYTLTVTDTTTGAVRSYHNLPRHLGSVADTLAFFAGSARPDDDAEAAQRPPILDGPRAPFDVVRPEENEERVGLAATSCLPDDLGHCLSGGRFRVTVSWRNPYAGGTTGVGHAVQLSADTGYFWFFVDTNVELVVKVLDGRGANGHFWVFYGALSDVEYTITVTDTQTGAVKSYYNPPRYLGSAADTLAF